MPHAWKLISYGDGPSGANTEWHCYRCKTTRLFWKRPDPDLRVQDRASVQYSLKTCDELLVRQVMED